MTERRVVITGTGAITPFGIGKQQFCANLFKGKSAASLITSFDASKLPTRFAAQVPLSDVQLDALLNNHKSTKTMSRSAKFAVLAAKEAMAESELDTSRLNPYRIGTSIGAAGLGFCDQDHTKRFVDIVSNALAEGREIDYGQIWLALLKQTHPLTPLKGLSNITTAHIAILFNARGNCITTTTACTSSAQAIGEAYRQIKYGISDVVIAGGSDSMVNPTGLVAFSGLGVISKNNGEYDTAARPFDKRRDGFMLGEGSAIFILEDLEHCKRRGAQPQAELSGYASTCDAFRLTDEPPEAWGIIEAMQGALADAQMNPENVNYVNAHGTGTPMNDKTETFSIRKVFRQHANSLSVSSTKSMIGHFVSAAGAVEVAACVLSIRHQMVAPTINYVEPDPECDLDYVPNQGREAVVNVILKNSFGFGGQNACLILKKFIQ